MRLVRPVSACVFIFAASTLIPMQITAAELTDDEIGQFRGLLEERRLSHLEKAGRLSDGEATARHWPRSPEQ